MHVAILTPNGFELREIAIPTIGDAEILVKTAVCGICSGDVFVYKNRQTLAQQHSRLGHEASGHIVAVGRSVTGFTVGERVTALSYPAYADYFVARPDELAKLPDEVDSLHALGEAIACCVHAANRFGIQPGDRVAVLGCGFMGQLCLQLACYHGAGFICAVDPMADRRKLAGQFGANATVNPFEQDTAAMLAQFGEFDVVIEAAGTQSVIDLATELVKQHGRIILVGYHQSNDGRRTVNMQQWNFKAIDVVNGHVRRNDEKLVAMKEGVRLMQQGHLNTAPLVTVYPLAEAERAFQELVNVKPGLLKAVLVPNDNSEE